MTEAQTRYFTLLETKRHNVQQEGYWTAQTEELKRSNQAQERLKSEANAISRYAVDVQKYGIQTQAATARYTAQVQAATSRYAALLNYSSSIYAANKAAETQRYVSDQNAATQRYAANLNAATNVYRTDVESENAQARLAFDRTTQLFKNSMDQKRYRLEQLRTTAQNALTRAQTTQASVQAQKLMSDIRVSVEQVTLAAKQYGLAEEAAKWNNALTRAREAEANSKTAVNHATFLEKMIGIAQDIFSLIDSL